VAGELVDERAEPMRRTEVGRGVGHDHVWLAGELIEAEPDALLGPPAQLLALAQAPVDADRTADTQDVLAVDEQGLVVPDEADAVQVMLVVFEPARIVVVAADGVQGQVTLLQHGIEELQAGTIVGNGVKANAEVADLDDGLLVKAVLQDQCDQPHPIAVHITDEEHHSSSEARTEASSWGASVLLDGSAGGSWVTNIAFPAKPVLVCSP
jgi:hypothetical protein